MDEPLPWPAYEAGELILGRPDSCVGICCLWSDRRRLAEKLDPSSYAALGNLYSSGGIGPLARNVLANPRLRYLVLCGADLTGSGAHLARLFEVGLDEQGRIGGTAVLLDPGFTPAAIDELRRRVRLVDLRGVTDPSRIQAEVAALPPMPPEGEPLVLPEAAATVEILPSEGVGYVVREGLISRAWLRCARLVLNFGRHDGERRVLRDVLVVAIEPPERIHLPSWLAETREQAAARAEQLKTWRAAHAGQRGEQAGAAPAPLLLEPGHLAEDGLSLSVVYASGDVARSVAAELYALRLLQADLAAQRGVACGPLVAHFLEMRAEAEDQPPLATLVDQHLPRQLPWRQDPRGVLHVRVENGEIVVEHGLTGLGKSGRVFRGASAQRLYKAVVHEDLLLYPEHAAYLGAELQKAEIALQLGVGYRQDEPLDLPDA